MTGADFRRIALSLEGAEEYDHAALPAFRVGGRKFASLASLADGYGNLYADAGTAGRQSGTSGAGFRGRGWQICAEIGWGYCGRTGPP